MTLRALGLVLFLPVPLVLWLFTQQPLGVALSLALGVVLVVTHRLYARPFALRHAPARCLWCGGAAGEGVMLELEEPLGRSAWRACGASHHERLRRVFHWAQAHAGFLKVLILGGLAVFLPAALLAGRRGLGTLTPADSVAFFRLAVAAAVLPLGWLAPRHAPDADSPQRVPFPVHMQALVGTLAVLWLFRLVGLWWLFLGLRHLWARL
jgi:hypothetical protein